MAEHLIICGCAENVWKDLNDIGQWFSLKEDDHRLIRPDVACINLAAYYYPYFFNYWISYHADFFKIRKYLKGSPTTHSCTHAPEVDKMWSFENYRCHDSGLLAVKIGMAMGYKKIILCGIPIDNSPHFYDKEPCQFSATNLQKTWEYEKRNFHDRVRSMSGNSLHLLGAPTKEWIDAI